MVFPLKFQAAVRSSRRKRNQYVVDLRDLVTDLKRRRQEAVTQNELLKQLIPLWERLVSEVETEVQDGVRHQLTMVPVPVFDQDTSTDFSEAELNTKLQGLKNQQQDTNHSEFSNLMFNSNETMLQFDTSDDRGAIEL